MVEEDCWGLMAFALAVPEYAGVCGKSDVWELPHGKGTHCKKHNFGSSSPLFSHFRTARALYKNGSDIQGVTLLPIMESLLDERPAILMSIQHFGLCSS